MKKIKLTKKEKNIEKNIEKYVEVNKTEFNQFAQAIDSRKKNSVLKIRKNHFE